MTVTRALIEELDKLLTAIITSAEGISDILFVAGKPPQVEVYGCLRAAEGVTEPVLTSERIQGLALGIINNNKLLEDLANNGSCDCSYSLAGVCRFRVNIYPPEWQTTPWCSAAFPPRCPTWKG